jgi:hypothetical protein
LLYNAPFGNSDNDASYVNGNPSTGTMGSIPPAASIEHPQREIVKVIQWAYDNKYTDMDGNFCEAPNFNLLDQLLKAMFGITNSRILRAPQTYYVNASGGNDTNDGLTAGTAFATIQHALDTATKWNQNGFGITINVAAGVYDGITLPQLNGSGGCSLVGSGTSTCTISGVNKSAIQQIVPSASYDIGYFSLTCSGVGVPGDHMCGIMMYAGNNRIHDCKFLNCGEAHMMTINDGTLIPYNGIEIAGNAGYHLWAEWNSHYTHAQLPITPVLTISQAVAFTYFAAATNGSLVVCNYKQIIGAGNVTGARYLVATNSIMGTAGGGANYLPGNAVGVVNTGGQYS